MQRRQMLSSLGVSVAVSLAGCIRGDDQAGQETDGISFFEDQLIEAGIDVEDVRIVNQQTALEYITERTTDEGLGDEIGTIAATYVRARENGLDTNRLNATISGGERSLAEWYIRPEWIEQFENDKISPEEFTTNVLNSVELIDS